MTEGFSLSLLRLCVYSIHRRKAQNAEPLMFHS